MADWVPIEDGFIAADVIRWTEKVYHPRRARRGRAVRLGERQVTAEVLQGPDSKGWVRLLVRQCDTLVELTVRKLPSYMNGAEIKRARKTIMRGDPERLLWSDESARQIVASEYPDTSATATVESGDVAENASWSRRHRRLTSRRAAKTPAPKP